jgi:hypothetical protein
MVVQGWLRCQLLRISKACPYLDIVPYAYSFICVSRSNNLKRKVLPPEHKDLKQGCVELTTEQGRPGWLTARAFISTSTTQIEINRAVSLAGIEDDGIRGKFDVIKEVLRMRVSAPTPRKPLKRCVRNLRLALGDGTSIY